MKNAVGSEKGDGLHAHTEGVGGRHGSRPPAMQGGGYQDICTTANTSLEKKCDARLVELREVGLSRAWLTVAEVIGVDAFLDAWKVLDQQAAHINPGQREIYVPLFASYLRFQRNRFILALADHGTSVDEIRRQVRTVLCEDISARHITRIVAKLKIVT